MIKRPLVWVLAAYIAGVLLAWCKASLFFIIVTLIAYIFILYLLFVRIQVKFLNKKDRFLWSLPVLLLLGLLAISDRMRPPELDRTFEVKAPCTITGKVTMETDRPQGKVLYLTGCMVSFKNNRQCQAGNIILYTSDSRTFLPGNRIEAAGTVIKLSKPSNPGQFNEYIYYKSENIDYKAYADSIIITDTQASEFRVLLQKVRDSLLITYKRLLQDKEAGTLTAIVLGDRYILSEDIKALYQESGISHILAISGLHVTLIGISIYKLLKKVKAGLIPAAIISASIMVLYGIMTGLSVSTHRAIVMFIVMMLAHLLGRTYDLLSALSLTALIILLQNPLQIFQAGFLFSFGAVYGIAVLYPVIKKLLGFRHALWDMVAVSFTVQAVTLPVLLACFYQFPLYGLIINLIVIPLMSALMLSALSAGIIGLLSLRLGIFLIGGANYILKLYEAICMLNAKLPKSLITTGKPAAGRIILYYILIILFIWGASKYKKKRMALIPLAAIVLLLLPVHKTGLKVTIPDMGQGEAIIINTDKGSTFLIDGGSSDNKKAGTYLLEPYLLSTGIDCVDYAIITHPDEDHISGLMELLSGHKITIHNLVLPDVFSGAGLTAATSDKMGREDYEELEKLAYTLGTKILYIDEGDTITEGKLMLTCLFPAKGLYYNSANAYSTVLSLSYGEFDMLLTGDLTSMGEEYILRKYFATEQIGYDSTDTNIHAVDSLSGIREMSDGYDILKVAHHGSKYSTSEEFLKIVKPKLSVISCGKNNRYGHPNRELLERLDDIGSSVAITYESGAITIRTDGKRMMVTKMTKG